MKLLILFGSCVLSAMWFRPWHVRPRTLGNSLICKTSQKLHSNSTSFNRTGLPRNAVLFGLIIGVVVVGALQPLLVLPLLGCYVVVVIRGRRRAPDDQREVAKALPEVVDLLLVGVGAGYTPRETLQRCQAWLPTPFAAAIAESLTRVAAGATFVEAMDRATKPLGGCVRPLVAALNAAEQDISTLYSGLLRVSDEARRRRRVAAQERARRVPVVMLGPLLLCVLPSFALLTLMPLVLGSLRDLGVVI